MEQKIAQHYSAVVGAKGPMSAVFFTGQDNNPALRIVLDLEADGQLLVDYLFSLGIDSTTNGAKQPKKVQSINNKFAVHIRLDQLNTYNQLKNLNWNTAMPANTVAVAQNPVAVAQQQNAPLPQPVPQHTQQMVQPQKAQAPQLPIPTLPSHLKKDKDAVTLTHTLAELIATAPNNSSKSDYLIQHFLGHWCLSDDRKTKRFILKKDLVQDVTYDPSAALARKIDTLIAQQAMAIKVVNRSIKFNPADTKDQEKHFYFLLLQAKDPSTYRPVKSLNNKDRYNKWHPKTGQTYTRPKKHTDRDVEKPHKIVTKKTSFTIIPTNPGVMNFFTNGHVVGIMTDVTRSDIKDEKYVFAQNANTDSLWWYNGGSNGGTVRSTSITTVRQNNDQAVRNFAGNNLVSHNESMICVRKYGFEGFFVRDDTQIARLNVLSCMYNTKREFGLDYALPVLVLPLSQRHKHYTLAEQLVDIVEAFKQPDNVIDKILLAQCRVTYVTNGHKNPDKFTYSREPGTEFFLVKEFIETNVHYFTPAQRKTLTDTFATRPDICKLVQATPQGVELYLTKNPQNTQEFAEFVQLAISTKKVSLNATNIPLYNNIFNSFYAHCEATKDPSLLKELPRLLSSLMTNWPCKEIHESLYYFLRKFDPSILVNSQACTHSTYIREAVQQDISTSPQFWDLLVPLLGQLGYAYDKKTGNSILHEIIINSKTTAFAKEIETLSWSPNVKNSLQETVFDILDEKNVETWKILITRLWKERHALKVSEKTFERIFTMFSKVITNSAEIRDCLKYFASNNVTISLNGQGGELTTQLCDGLAKMMGHNPDDTAALANKLIPSLPKKNCGEFWISDVIQHVIRQYLSNIAKKGQDQALASFLSSIPKTKSKAASLLVHQAIIKKFYHHSLKLAEIWPADLVTPDKQQKDAIDYLMEADMHHLVFEMLEKLIQNDMIDPEEALIKAMNLCCTPQHINQVANLLLKIDLSKHKNVLLLINSFTINMIAEHVKNPAIIKHFAKHNIAFDFNPSNQFSPIDASIRGKNDDVTHELFNLQFNINYNDEDILYTAAVYGEDRHVLQLCDQFPHVHRVSKSGETLSHLIKVKKYKLVEAMISKAIAKDPNAENAKNQSIFEVIPQDCAEVWKHVFNELILTKSKLNLKKNTLQHILESLLLNEKNIDAQLEYLCEFLSVINMPRIASPINTASDTLNHALFNNCYTKSPNATIKFISRFLSHLPPEDDLYYSPTPLFVAVVHHFIVQKDDKKLSEWLGLHALTVYTESHQIVHMACKHKLFAADYVEQLASLWPNDLSTPDSTNKTPISYLLLAGKIDIVHKLIAKNCPLIDETIIELITFCKTNQKWEDLTNILTQGDFSKRPAIVAFMHKESILHHLVENKIAASSLAKIFSENTTLASPDTRGLTVVDATIKSGHLEATREVFIALMKLNQNTDSILYLAALFGDERYIKELFNKKRKQLPHLPSNSGGDTPLQHIIVTQKKYALAKEIVDITLSNDSKEEFTKTIFPSVIDHIETVFDRNASFNLFKALCEKKYFECILQLIPKTSSLLDDQMVDKNQNTRLHLAVMNSCTKEIIVEIIQHGCNLNARNDQDKTPLDLAIERRLWPQVEILISQLTSGYDATRLAKNVIALLSEGQFKSVDSILFKEDAAIDYTVTDNTRTNLLHLAVQVKDQKLVHAIHTKAPKLLDEYNEKLETPLMAAVREKNDTAVAYFVDQLTTEHPAKSATYCFDELVKQNKWAQARSLLQKVARVSPKVVERNIIALVKNNQDDIIRILGEKIKDLPAQDNAKSAFTHALRTNKLSCVRAMINLFPADQNLLVPKEMDGSYLINLLGGQNGFKDLLDRTITDNDRPFLRFLLQKSHIVSKNIVKEKLAALINTIKLAGNGDDLKRVSLHHLKMVLKHAVDLPDNKSLVFNAGLLLGQNNVIKQPIGFFGKMRAAAKQKQTANVAYVTEKLKTLNDQDEILALVSRLEADQKANNNFLIKPLRILFGWFAFIWNNIKTSSTWSYMMKMAKNRLLEIAINSADPAFLTQQSKDFLNQNRFGWKVRTTRSTTIHNRFFKPVKPDDAQKARAELQKEQAKVNKWLTKEMGMGAPAA